MPTLALKCVVLGTKTDLFHRCYPAVTFEAE